MFREASRLYFADPSHSLLADTQRDLHDDAQQRIRDARQANQEEVQHLRGLEALHIAREATYQQQLGNLCTSFTPRLNEEQIHDLDRIFQGSSVTASMVQKGRSVSERPIEAIDPGTAYDLDDAYDSYFYPSNNECSWFGKWMAAHRDHFGGVVLEFHERVGFGFRYFAFLWAYQRPYIAFFLPMHLMPKRIPSSMMLSTRVSQGFHKDMALWNWGVSPLAFCKSSEEMGNPPLDRINVTFSIRHGFGGCANCVHVLLSGGIS